MNRFLGALVVIGLGILVYTEYRAAKEDLKKVKVKVKK